MKRIEKINKTKSIFKNVRTYWKLVTPFRVILGFIFIAFLILRFMQPETRAVFGWDQVVNSWVVKDMILAGKRPLTGMVAKMNTGFYIGPAYYYLLAPFYWVFRLDPVANSYFAGTIAVMTFSALFWVTRRLFDRKTVLIALFIYTFSSNVIRFDRIAWPVNLIPLTSLLAFYFLYRVLRNELKFLIPLALTIGFAFHTHFTAVYYVMIVFFSAPLVFRQPGGLIRSFAALPFFLVWLVPNLISETGKGFSATQNMAYYLNTFFHGLHLRRVLQLTNDAFIEFEANLFFRYLKPLNILIPAIFSGLLLRSLRPDRKILLFIFTLWFGVPWLVMSLYAGEITNYYFSITRPVAVIVIGYVLSKVFVVKNKLPSVILVIFAVYWSYANILHFLGNTESDLVKNREEAKKAIREDKKIEFVEWEAKSYLYEVYKNVYHYKNEASR
jgi:4-amino-4-deoxy-L-arabinose transferase-like glycosyltransferase